jgi:hypothetical protein
MTSTNTARIGLTAHTEAADEAEDEASKLRFIYIEGGEEAHTEEAVNVMEETREQDFSRRDVRLLVY